MQKTCSKCKASKEATTENFARRSSSPDGLYSSCKKCGKEYREKTKDKIKLRNIRYINENQELYKELCRKSYLKHKERRAEYRREYDKRRKEQDHVYRLGRNIRSAITAAIGRSGFTKRAKTHAILGCSFDELAAHLERQFVSGMTWENRGKWHIDHIVPIASAQSEEDVIRLNHFTNLRPVWAKENLSKGKRVDYLL